MEAVRMLEKGQLDIAVVGSSPATIAISTPNRLPVEIVSVSNLEWDAVGLIVRNEIRSPKVARVHTHATLTRFLFTCMQDLRGKTIATRQVGCRRARA